ncbi:MAG: hypothetical protein K5928_07905 [Prevotella sp.]|nr:hypothetical protein [Prevotella sp.]
MKKIFTLFALMLGMASTAVAQDTWTVTGTAAALKGTADWDPTDATNDMTQQADGTYKLEVTDCTLEKSSEYKYKVVKNHSWAEAYPSSDKVFTVQETAVYTVVYTFNAETKEVSETVTKTGEAGVVTHTYTVAGVAALCGSNWNPADATNDMTLQGDGTYQLVKTALALAAGRYEYKVAQDHAWGQSWPGSNAILVINEDGKYDVTFTFEPNSGNKVSATAEKKGDAIIEETWLVAGDSEVLFGTTWDATNEANKMTKDENENWVKIYQDVNLSMGTIEYKFVHNGSEWIPENNEKLEIPEDGKYTVTFTYITEDNEINATAEKTGESDGIEAVAAGKQTFVWFDLQGRSVKAPAKGLYIRDGKKIILK